MGLSRQPPEESVVKTRRSEGKEKKAIKVYVKGK